MNYKVNAPSGLNVRSGPGTDYEVLDQMLNGQVFTGLDDLPWVPYVYKDDEEGVTFGWVATKYLVKVEAPRPTPGGIVTGAMVVNKFMTQKGKPYIFGYEVNLNDPSPPAFDCSEGVQWTCAQLHITPVMPDGAANQYEHCKKYGTIIPIEEAIRTAGALLFRISSEGNHVVISRGDGTTIEARGAAYGVGVWNSTGRDWTGGAKIPGVTYGV